jgi:hypothetical protein
VQSQRLCKSTAEDQQPPDGYYEPIDIETAEWDLVQAVGQVDRLSLICDAIRAAGYVPVIP